jgi:hypothetical protein
MLKPTKHTTNCFVSGCSLHGATHIHALWTHSQLQRVPSHSTRQQNNDNMMHLFHGMRRNT